MLDTGKANRARGPCTMTCHSTDMSWLETEADARDLTSLIQVNIRSGNIFSEAQCMAFKWRGRPFMPFSNQCYLVRALYNKKKVKFSAKREFYFWISCRL